MADKYTVKLYPKALRELDEIYRYIYEVIQVPQYADDQLERLEEGIFFLERLPYRCTERKTGVYEANRSSWSGNTG